MSQLNSFVISAPNISAQVSAVMDSLLSTYGKVCSIYYAPIKVGCNNCSPNFTGDHSNGIYLDGGPQSFADGQNCPMCGGGYWFAQESSEQVIMTIKWLPANYRPDFPAGNNYANATIMSRGLVSDMQKINNSNYMEFDKEGGFGHYRFKLLGQPAFTDQFTDCRYFYAYWEQT